MTATGHLKFAGETNRGLVRARNEDNFFYVRRSGRPALAMVADGIGGHRDGDVASFFCCRKLLTAWHDNAGAVHDSRSAHDFLERELQKINRELYTTNRLRRGGGQPMGTTVTAAIFLDDEVICCHAGDSRMYRYNETEGLVQVTQDHTLLRKLEESGRKMILPPAPELENVIARAVGPRPQVELEFSRMPRLKKSRYLLSSDGLTRYVDAEYLAIALGSGETPRDSVNRLMRASLIAGGADNITIICVFDV